MRLQHTHSTRGPVSVTVSAPEHTLFLYIDPDALYASADVVTDAANAAWAGPTGLRGSGFGIEVGKPSLINSARKGSYVSGGGTVLAGGDRSVASGGGRGGTVRATGRGSVAAGGDITNVVTGDGSRIVGSQSAPAPEKGIHLLAPQGCTFTFQEVSFLSVFRRGEEVTLTDAEANGWLVVKR